MDNERAGMHGQAGGRILLVEDDPMIRTSLEWVLPSLGHQVSGFETGEDALRSVPREERGLYQYLIVDLSLPGMRGEAFTREWLVSISGVTSTLPVVIFCSGLQEGDLRLAAASISTLISDDKIHFLRKPFRIDELQRTLAHGDLNLDRSA